MASRYGGPPRYAPLLDVVDADGFLNPPSLECAEDHARVGGTWALGDCGTVDELIRRLRSGFAQPAVLDAYRELQPVLGAAFAPYLAKVPTLRRRAVRRDEGAELDADRWAMGDADCWKRFERQARPGISRTLKIGVEFATYGDVDVSYYAKLGAVVGAVVEAVRTSRIAVEVYGLRTSSGMDGRRYGQRWRLCSFAERWDVDRFLSWAEPGVFRALCFQWFHSVHGRHFSRGAGGRFDPDDSLADYYGVDLLVWHGDIAHRADVCAQQLGARVAKALGVDADGGNV